MTAPRKPGRPPRTDAATGRAAILDTALARIEAGEAVSFRALGTALGVTAMAVSHHVGDHAGLMRALTDRAFAALPPPPPEAAPADRLRHTLTAYVARAAAFPRLMRETLADPSLSGAELGALDARLLADAGALPAAHGTDPTLMRDILVDHAHGTILALARAAGPQERDAILARYATALDHLLRDPA